MSNKPKQPMRYEPDYTVVPGETLGERLIELGMDQRELAMRLEISTKCVSQIINGKAPITHKIAIGLERVTGVPSHVWNNLEMNYRESLASIADQDQQISKRSIHDFDDFALDMVNLKAAELVGKAGFTADDFEDIRQDMLLDLMERLAKYDPSKSSFKLFVTCAIDRKVQNMIRYREEAKQS